MADDGAHGTPRPAVILQTDAVPESHAPVVVCQLNSDLVDVPDFGVAIEPKPENGLRLRSRVMADKPVPPAYRTPISASSTFSLHIRRMYALIRNFFRGGRVIFTRA